MVAGADFVVDTVFDPRDALPALESLRIFRTHAALTRELTFAVGNDDLESALGGLHRIFQRLHHFGDAVSAHLAHPGDAHRAQGRPDVHAGGAAGAARLAGGHVLQAGRRGVAVLHDD